jgi:hypothetical protein
MPNTDNQRARGIIMARAMRPLKDKIIKLEARIDMLERAMSTVVESAEWSDGDFDNLEDAMGNRLGSVVEICRNALEGKG